MKATVSDQLYYQDMAISSSHFINRWTLQTAQLDKYIVSLAVSLRPSSAVVQLPLVVLLLGGALIMTGRDAGGRPCQDQGRRRRVFAGLRLEVHLISL